MAGTIISPGKELRAPGESGGFMGSVIGELLPNALGVALSPMPLIGLLFVLFTVKARLNSVAFLVGWMLGVIVPVSLVVLLNLQARTGAPSATSGWINLGVGVLFVYLAWSSWSKRPRPGQPATKPGWLATLEAAKPLPIAGIAAFIIAINAKNIGLLVTAGLVISGSQLGTGGKIIAILAYAILASIIAIVIVGSFLIMGKKVEPQLLAMRHWLEANNAYVMMILFGYLGFAAIGKALQILT